MRFEERCSAVAAFSLKYGVLRGGLGLRGLAPGCIASLPGEVLLHADPKMPEGHLVQAAQQLAALPGDAR